MVYHKYQQVNQYNNTNPAKHLIPTLFLPYDHEKDAITNLHFYFRFAYPFFFV